MMHGPSIVCYTIPMKTPQELAQEYVVLVNKTRGFDKRRALLAEYTRKLLRIKLKTA